MQYQQTHIKFLLFRVIPIIMTFPLFFPQLACSQEYKFDDFKDNFELSSSVDISLDQIRRFDSVNGHIIDLQEFKEYIPSVDTVDMVKVLAHNRGVCENKDVLCMSVHYTYWLDEDDDRWIVDYYIVVYNEDGKIIDYKRIAGSRIDVTEQIAKGTLCQVQCESYDPIYGYEKIPSYDMYEYADKTTISYTVNHMGYIEEHIVEKIQGYFDYTTKDLIKQQ